MKCAHQWIQRNEHLWGCELCGSAGIQAMKPAQAVELDIIHLFKLGMKRDIQPLLEAPHVTGVQLNLGAGNQQMDGVINLDYPTWDADVDNIPYADNSVDSIYAFHFFEHLVDPRPTLRECFRVLVPQGTLNIVVPYWNCQLAWQDLDHKKAFTLDTWATLKDTTYYEKEKVGWPFIINTNIVIGVAERNLAIMTQLVKI